MSVRRKVIPIFIPHLGCMHDCVFCNQRKISGQLKPATAAAVTELIKNGLERNTNNQDEIQVAFYGGSFTAIAAEEQENLMGAALPFLCSGMVSSLRVSTRPDCIDDEIIERLKRFGVKTVELGVQSMDENVLLDSNRGHTADDAKSAAKKLKKAGFELILQMMTGLPGDSKEKSLYTAYEFIKLAPDGVRIYPTVIIKDTKLYEQWKENKYKEHTVDEAVEWCAEITEIFLERKIPIIRLGLNPTDDLSSGEAVAGAYHPALGELIYSKVYLNKMRVMLKDASSADRVEVAVARGQLSQAVGQHKINYNTLKSEFKIKELKFIEKDIPCKEIEILNIAKIS